MSYLICNSCLQVPFIEFLPSLTTKFTCCKTYLLRHFDLDRHIKKCTNMKCSTSQCEKQETNFHFFLRGLKCDDCFKKYLSKNNNKIPNNYIKSDSFSKVCKNHFKNYLYYDPKSHLLFCQYCIIPNSAKKISELKKDCNNNLLLNDFEIKENYSKYYEHLVKIIIETYKTYGKSIALNAYFNLVNLKIFLKQYSTILPLCQECKEIVRFNIKNNNFIIQ